jgi:hypothetical protein
VSYSVKQVPAILTVVIKSVQNKFELFLRLAHRRIIHSILFSVLLSLLPACRTTSTLPPVNLSESGWAVRQGQAVWRSKKEAPEIAGELLVATNLNARSMVQFIKTPLPLVVAQTTADSWQIHFVPNNKTFSGQGTSPSRLARRYLPYCWLYVARCLSGVAPPEPWSWQQLPNNNWRLENRKTGESLEGYLNP